MKLADWRPQNAKESVLAIFTFAAHPKMLQRQCFFDPNQLLLIFSRFHSIRIQVESFVDWSFKAWFYDRSDIISGSWVKVNAKIPSLQQWTWNILLEANSSRKISLAGFFRAFDDFFLNQNPAIWSLGCVVSSEGKHFGRGLKGYFPLGWGCRSWRSLCDRCPPSRSLELVVKTESPEGMDPKG